MRTWSSVQPTTSHDVTHAQSLDETLLDVIRAAMDGAAPLGALAPDTYARDHAEFESRSDQRRLITSWLAARLAQRAGAVSVLSVGCGDGSVDAELADLLIATDATRAVRYVGVEPFAGSAAGFARRMDSLGHANLDATVHVSTFDDAPLHTGEQRELFDVITFVHSMYYVPDVASTLKAARSLLRPGGELIVLSAPRGALNKLVGVLAPPIEGHRQWFSDDVSAGFVDAGITLDETGTLDACVDLTDASDDVLDFTVQARLTDDLRPLVLAYLGEVSVTEDKLALPHPVDIYRAAAEI